MLATASRRQVIRGIFGLATLAVVPGTALALPQDDVDRFLDMARSGLVEGREFLLHRPIVLTDAHNLHISRCKFVAGSRFKGGLIKLRSCDSIRIDGAFDLRGMGEYAIEVDGWCTKLWGHVVAESAVTAPRFHIPAREASYA